MKDKIKVGDLVSVNFNGAQMTLCHTAMVEYIPCATGDSWVFVDNDTNQIHYVSEPCTISLIDRE